MKLPDPNQFHFKECTIAGDECYLIHPKDMATDWTDENSRFRSCIVRKSDNLVVSQGFRKFVNLGEKPAFETWNFGNKFEARRKLDGCCDEDTILLTEDGEKTIREICESSYKGKVLGFNHQTNHEEYTAVIAHSIKSNNDDWYLLELKDGSYIKLTGNHRVYLPNLDCYRCVEDLTIEDEFLLIKI